jgi:hypothetical protein
MLASSVEIARCTDDVEAAVARPILDGTKHLQSVAIPTRVGCACRARRPGCATRHLSRPIVPVDAAHGIILHLRATHAGRQRLQREMPAALHRMTATNEWETTAALCRRFPLCVATVVENTDKWGGDTAVVPLQALCDFAVAGVLGPATLKNALPTAFAGRLTCAQAAQAVRVHTYDECLLKKQGTSKHVTRILTACLPLPREIVKVIARLATARALPKRQQSI